MKTVMKTAIAFVSTAFFGSGCSCMSLFSEDLGPAGDADVDMDVDMDVDTDIDTDVDTDTGTDTNCDPFAPDNAGFPFAFTAVDGSTYDGSGASIAADADGAAHIAYGNGHLRYANNVSGAFIAETVDPGWGGAPGLDLDAGGAVHIAYPADAGLGYANTETGSWALETIEALDVENIEVAAAADGSVHVAYTTLGAPGFVRYAVRRDGRFVAEEVAELCSFSCDPFSGDGGGAALAVDADGAPHLLYQDWEGSLVHAVRDAVGWARETISAEGGLAGTLAIDGGDLHAAYGIPTGDGVGGQEVRYALGGDGREWSIEVVDPSGRPMSLALEPDGSPSLVWGNAYATRDGAGWSIEVVTVDGDHDVDAAGDVHVAWSASSDLWYAHRVAPDGIDQNCDGVDGVDADRDGFASPPTGGLDCDDASAAVHPGADDPAGDGIDQNCDGSGGAG